MRTSKAVSTISYNSPEFLRAKIEYWRETGKIEYAMWIRHEPEEDEKKAHYHVYLKPAKLVQTTDLEDESRELDPTWKAKESYKDEKEKEAHEKKMFLKMISFRISKEADWLLYSIHDPAYLAEKGLTRQHHYGFDDVETTCEDTYTDIISHLADDRKGRLEYRIVECVGMGMTWQEIVRSGIVPIRNISGALIMYKALTGQDHNFI